MNADSTPSFISKLMERRFFQFLGSYLLGAWALVQFIDWMAVRFDYSKSIPETALTFFALMIPSAVLIIYFHGKSGTQQWNMLEKIVIPLNLIVAVFLSMNFFTTRIVKEVFESPTSKITVFDENGNEIERFVPESSSTRRIITFPFINRSKKETDQWQSFGLPTLLSADIEQDNRLYSTGALNLVDDFIGYGYDISKQTPLSILRKIADDYYSDFFFTGDYEIIDGLYKVNVEAFSTVDGQSFFVATKEGNNFFDIVDDISKEFKEHLSLPDTEKDIPIVDLPSNNLYTLNVEAFKDFINSASTNFLDNDPTTAVSLLENAIAKDPNCVECYSFLGRMNFRINQTAKALSAYQNAIKRIDALPERQQLNIKYWNYFANNQTEKAIALSKMWMEFYPNDLKPYNYLIEMYRRQAELDKAREVAKKALNVGHKGTIFTLLANIALLQHNLPEAKKYYTQFQEAYPHRAKETKGLADIYVKEGDYEKARAHLKKLQVLDSNDESIPRKLAEVEYDAGNPDKAVEYIGEAVSLCSNTRDSVTALTQLETYYTALGQVNKALQLKKKRRKLQLAFSSPTELDMEFMQFNVIDQYIKAGKRDEIEKILEPFMEENPSYPILPCMARINFYLAVKDVAKATKYEKECRDLVIQSQGATTYLAVDAFMAELNGNYAEAIKFMEQLIKTVNVKNSYLDTFIIRYYRLNNQLEACKNLADQYLKINPVSPDVYYQLGLAYQQEGNKAEAIANFKKALDIWKNADENYTPAQEVRAALAGMVE